MQESVIFFLWYDILVSNVILLSVFNKTTYFNVKCHYVYKLKIHKYEIKCVLRKYAHNGTQYEDKKIM